MCTIILIAPRERQGELLLIKNFDMRDKEIYINKFRIPLMLKTITFESHNSENN